MIFAYGAITRYGSPFQADSANQISFLSLPIIRQLADSRRINLTTPAGVNAVGFGLLPFRSPLLRE